MDKVEITEIYNLEGYLIELFHNGVKQKIPEFAKTNPTIAFWDQKPNEKNEKGEMPTSIKIVRYG